MSTHGSAKEAFNEEGLDFLSGEFLPYLAEDDYYSAFENFANNAGRTQCNVCFRRSLWRRGVC